MACTHKALVTDIAHERSGRGMRQRVALEVSGTAELFATDVASVSLVCVRQIVVLQVADLGEALATFLTHVGTLSGVDTVMNF